MDGVDLLKKRNVLDISVCKSDEAIGVKMYVYLWIKGDYRRTDSNCMACYDGKTKTSCI